MTSTPLVSVILPTYNRLTFLPEAVESILNQNLIDFELIIINDGSTDGTEEWVSMQTDERIRYIGYPENRGASFARNKGLDIAQGKYIAFVDSDDVNEKTRFEEQVSVLESDKQVAICSSNIRCFGLKNRLNEYTDTLLPFRIKALFGVPFPFPACMVRRSFLERENIRFRSKMRASDDYHFLMKIVAKGKAVVIQKPLYKYRVHEASITYRRSEEQKANSLDNSQLAFQEILKLSLKEEEVRRLKYFYNHAILPKEVMGVRATVQKVINFVKQTTDLKAQEKDCLLYFLTDRILYLDKKQYQLLCFFKRKLRGKITNGVVYRLGKTLLP